MMAAVRMNEIDAMMSVTISRLISAIRPPRHSQRTRSWVA
jgi:hypothetical protein